MRDVGIEAALVGLGVPVVAFGSALAASYLSPTQLLVPWLCAAVVSIAAVISAAVITREASAHKHQEEDQRQGVNEVEHLADSTLKTESPSCSTATFLCSIMASATVAGGKEKNEDHVGSRPLDGCNVLAIADGVSGSPRGKLAAKAAVEGFLTKIEEIWQQRHTIGRGDVGEAYIAARDKIREHAEEAKREKGLASLNPQTTFIGIIELDNRFIFTYIGDGAIVLFRAAADVGVVLHYPKSLLIPHSIGKNFPTRLLSADAELPKHSYMEVDKTLEGGEIVVAGTDGALPMGSILKTSEGILNDLKHMFQKNYREFDTETVNSFLRNKLEQFTTDDNRTLGVILTQNARNSWLRELQREDHKQHSVPGQE